jgi:hypothetical protein
MFLDLLDPDPLVRVMDPVSDPELLSISKNSKKNLYFFSVHYLLSLMGEEIPAKIVNPLSKITANFDVRIL